MKALTYIEIDVPEFAGGPGTGEKEVVPGLEYDFETNSVLGWSGAEATVTATTSGMTVAATGDDPIIRSPSGLTIDGASQRYIAIDIERTGVRTLGFWQGQAFYTTAGHFETGSFLKSIPEIENTLNARELIVLDMHDLDAGGADWAESVITQIRLDFEDGQPGVTPNGTFKIHSVIIGGRVETYRFAEPTEYLPREIEAIPSITSVSYTPAKISLGKDLGQRATLSISLKDHRHIFDGEPFNSGSFWGKWRARYGQRLRGFNVRWIQGLLGQTLAEMETRHFIVEATDGPNTSGVYTFTAKDVLKFASGDRAQAPRVSNGFIVGDIDNNDTAVTLSPTGVGNLEYPASGHVAIGGEEIVSFTRSGDVLTIARAQLGTLAVAHEAGDRAQLVLRYVGEDPANIIADLLENYAEVPGAYIPIAAWLTETGSFLQRLYTATIPEPTAVDKLVSELIEQAALAMWWEPVSQQIRLQVLRSIATTADRFTEQNTLEGSLTIKDQPNTRLSQVWTYFGQRNSLEPVDEPDNYRSIAATVDLEAETAYGNAVIKKIYSRWIPFGGRQVALRLNDLQLGRFRDPPRQFTFSLFRRGPEDPQLGGGYRIEAWPLQTITGEPTDAPVQITSLKVSVDKYQIEAEEALFGTFEPDDLTNRVIIIDSNINNVNLRDVHDSIYPDPTGAESPPITITVYIEAGVIVGSGNISTPAFDVGSWPVGVSLIVYLRGRIQGKGGDGGAAHQYAPGNGQPGSTALYCRFPIDLILNEGEGEAWGGGGGGGGSNTPSSGSGGAGGGGGGAGQTPGAGAVGAEVSGGNQGAGFAGTTELGGDGGAAKYKGGDGGDPGQAGEGGLGPSPRGAGGAAGAAIDGLSYITKTGTGDIRGSQIN